ncbi:hypothetical protein PhCBS80983_g06288 [Powellomyces hirtus]|uniref:DJ-1/PfpI domain-containing protein n=1 Tax=Powellomyces hirtus TaxID=109895 RepID=A0A507DPY2_9FUNG|nr:hypothetical protein PhCBS80983_g06288 [Powellomyces hirtus]
MTVIAALLFPGWELLDVQGPYAVLAKAAALSNQTASPSQQPRFVVVAETTAKPVHSSAHFPVLADYDYKSCPQVDLLLIPGGPGTLHYARDSALLTFVRKQSEAATYVASICTGSSILAEAGLLARRKATTNKALYSMQTQYGGGAIEWIHKARYVVDGKFMTASGVSAGLDLGFELARLLFGDGAAQKVANATGYTPLSDGEDPFATLHKKGGGLGSALYFHAAELLATSITKQGTDSLGKPYFTPLGAPPLPFPPFTIARPHAVTVFLLPGFDALDIAMIGEACFGLERSHKMELVAVGHNEAGKDEEIDKDRLIVGGGDATSSAISPFARIVRVQCDRSVNNRTAVFPQSQTPQVGGKAPAAGAGLFSSGTSSSNVVILPSVPESKTTDIFANPDSPPAVILQAIMDAKTNNSGATVLACGDLFAYKLRELGVVDDQAIKAYESDSRWGRAGTCFIAKSGVTAVTPMLTIVNEQAGLAATKSAAMKLEICPRLLPEGVVLS